MSLTYLLSALLIYLPQTSATMYQTEPILWTDTKTSLKSGESEIKWKIHIIKPCENFYDPSIVNGTQEYFTTWCNKEVDENIIKPLEELCRPSFATETRRKKRFIRRVFRGVVNVAQSILGIGSSSSDSYINGLATTVNRLSIDMFAIKAAIAAGEKRQAEFDKKLNEYDEALEKLNDRVSKNEVDIQTLKQWKDDLIKSLGTTVTLVSKLSAYFALSKSNLNQVTRDWRNGTLNLQLFEVFMTGSNYTLIDMYANSKPVECHFNTRDGVVDFIFQKNDTDFGIHVLKANPFTLYQEIPGTYLGYRLDYVGPEQVAYDSTNECIVPYSGTATELIMFPGDKDCLPMNDLSVYKYWKKSCFPMYYLDETSIQFKVMGDSVFVYCYGFSISIYKSEYKCPNHVFSVHVNETVRILNGKSVTRRMKPEDFSPAQDFYSKKVTYHLMPRILNLNFDGFNLSQNCPYDQDINFIDKFRDVRAAAIPVYVLLCIFGMIVIILAIGGLYYVKWSINKNVTVRAYQAGVNRTNFPADGASVGELELEKFVY